MQGQGPHFPPTRKATIHIHRGEGGKGVKMGTLHWGGGGGGACQTWIIGALPLFPPFFAVKPRHLTNLSREIQALYRRGVARIGQSKLKDAREDTKMIRFCWVEGKFGNGGQEWVSQIFIFHTQHSRYLLQGSK